jgi:hypothetical protein
MHTYARSCVRASMHTYIHTRTYCRYEGCPESNASCFFRSKYLFENHENNTYSSEKDCLQTLFSNKVSVHFYSLVQTSNNCVYTLSVPCLILLLFVSSVKWWNQVSSAVAICVYMFVGLCDYICSHTYVFYYRIRSKISHRPLFLYGYVEMVRWYFRI